MLLFVVGWVRVRCVGFGLGLRRCRVLALSSSSWVGLSDAGREVLQAVVTGTSRTRRVSRLLTISSSQDDAVQLALVFQKSPLSGAAVEKVLGEFDGKARERIVAMVGGGTISKTVREVMRKQEVVLLEPRAPGIPGLAEFLPEGGATDRPLGDDRRSDDSIFLIEAPYQPMGDQPKAIDALVRGLKGSVDELFLQLKLRQNSDAAANSFENGDRWKAVSNTSGGDRDWKDLCNGQRHQEIWTTRPCSRPKQDSCRPIVQ